jgi:ribonuclease-3
MTKQRESLEKLFRNKENLTKALTHRSYLNENSEATESNERMEFLGDAVLELIVSENIFIKFPKKEEGYLTALRASLVNAVHLAKIANKLGIGNMILLSHGEEKGGGRQSIALLSNTMEAVIGALYIDSGYETCKTLVAEVILSDIPKKSEADLKDPKSMLQEIIQNKKLKPPEYEVVEAHGPDHAKLFTVEVSANGRVLGKATGTSKAHASQKAAKKALLRFAQK